MNINVRRAIALFFLVIFVIGTPILIFYASGYRYNVKKGKIEKSGGFVIESEPSRAGIFLNGKFINESTPARLKNIVQDNYNVRLEKEGYYSWEKDLEIKSQETTFAEDIILFKQTEPEKVIESEIQFISFSPDHSYAVFTTSDFEQDYLYLINLNNQKYNLIYNNNKKFTEPSVYWADDASEILFVSNGDRIIIPTQFPKNSFSLTKFFDYPKAINYKWDAYNNNRLFAQTNNTIFEINSSAKKAKNIFALEPSERLIDFYIQENNIYYIFGIENKTFLGKSNLTDKKLQKTLELKNDSYKFDKFYGDKIAIFDNKLPTLYLINQEIDSIYFQKSDVKNLDFHKQKNLLLMQTHQDLSFLDLNEPVANEKNITRYSSNLTDAKWHKSTNYAIDLQNETINIIELDDRDSHFILSLPYQNITNFSIDKDSETIYFIQNNLLYSLEIK